MGRILVTGSAGHLGEAMMLSLKQNMSEDEVIGVDICSSTHTTHIGSVTDRAFVQSVMAGGVDVVYHTAGLQKPHMATHSRQDFVDTNIGGTLNLLEEAAVQGTKAFVFTSTTSLYGDALQPRSTGDPAVWITEDTVPIPKNIYGVTKSTAEDLCQLAHRNQGLNCVILRTSRFFPEDDDAVLHPDSGVEREFCNENMKANEYLYRRVDIADVVSAHRHAATQAPSLGFDKFIISATTPFTPEDLGALYLDGRGVVAKYFPEAQKLYARLNWNMNKTFDRVYCNEKARRLLQWEPKFDFRYILERLAAGESIASPLAVSIGIKGYHKRPYDESDKAEEAEEASVESSRYETCEKCECNIDCWHSNIYILTKGSDDMCLCRECFESCEEKMKAEGWECDDWDE